MGAVSASAPPVEPEGYRHEALFYAGLEGFVERVGPFLRDGIAAGEPVLVVVSAEKIARLRAALGDDAAHVLFADMEDVGANPARIIPAWHDFVAEHRAEGRRLRGVGEPIHPGRNDAEMAECHRHEALLNLAFADEPDFWLVCPYDVDALPEHVLHEAQRTHPAVCGESGSRASRQYAGEAAIAAPFDDPLPPPAAPFHAQAFDIDTLADLRRFVADHARAAGLAPGRVEDLVVAASEVATNSVRYGGGAGVLRMWVEHDTVLCEARDRGTITAPLVGRVEPSPTAPDGRGLWLANLVCDLVQVRAFRDGGAVRLHVRR